MSDFGSWAIENTAIADLELWVARVEKILGIKLTKGQAILILNEWYKMGEQQQDAILAVARSYGGEL